MSDGSEMKITVAKWYTPLDHGIDKIGILPDIEVKFEKEDFEKHFDRQLEVAKKVLGEFILQKDPKKAIESYTREQELVAKKKLESTTGSGSKK